MSVTDNRPPRDPWVDLTPIFGKLNDTLDLLNAGIKLLVAGSVKQSARFLVYAANPQESPLQKSVNGTIRSIHNNSGVAITLLVVDGMESVLVGSPGFPVNMAAGAFIPCYIPFKNGLRATVGGGGFVSMGGDVN